MENEKVDIWMSIGGFSWNLNTTNLGKFNNFEKMQVHILPNFWLENLEGYIFALLFVRLFGCCHGAYSFDVTLAFEDAFF